jgi:hypothetical protein
MSEPDTDNGVDPEDAPKNDGPWAKTSSGDADSITEDDDED